LLVLFATNESITHSVNKGFVAENLLFHRFALVFSLLVLTSAIRYVFKQLTNSYRRTLALFVNCQIVARHAGVVVQMCAKTLGKFFGLV